MNSSSENCGAVVGNSILDDSFTPPRRSSSRQQRRYHHHYDFQDRPPLDESLDLLAPSTQQRNGDKNTNTRGAAAVSPLFAADPLLQQLQRTGSGVVEHDTVVRVGRDAQRRSFFHSSLILSYASTVLAEHLEHCCEVVQQPNRPEDGRFVLDIPHKPASDWECLQAFLEPHAVQQAVITRDNLPMLLPWFLELQLTVLLRECDVRLRQHVVRHHSPTTNTATAAASQQDMSNLLMLCKIAVQANLAETAEAAFTSAAAWLQQRPDLWVQQKNGGGGASVDLLEQMAQLLLQCLRPETETTTSSNAQDDSADEEKKAEPSAPSSRPPPFEPQASAKLFVAAIAYLPADCLHALMQAKKNPIQELLSNALFPYLAREGILRHRPPTPPPVDDTSTPGRTSTSNNNNKSSRDGTTTSSGSPTKKVDSPPRPAYSFHTVKSFGSVTSGSTAALQQVATEFQAGLQQFLFALGQDDTVAEPADEATDTSKDDVSPPQPSSSLNADPGSFPPDETAVARGAWLERIWQKLNEPPALDGSALPHRSAVDRTSGGKQAQEQQPQPPRRRRTFAC